MKKIALLVCLAFVAIVLAAPAVEAQTRQPVKKVLRPGVRPGSKWGHLNAAADCITKAKTALRARQFRAYNLYLAKARVHLLAAHVNLSAVAAAKARFNYQKLAVARLNANKRLAATIPGLAAKPEFKTYRGHQGAGWAAIKQRRTAAALVHARKAFAILLKVRGTAPVPKDVAPTAEEEKAVVEAEKAPEAPAPAAGPGEPAPGQEIGAEGDKAAEVKDEEAAPAAETPAAVEPPTETEPAGEAGEGDAQ